LRQIFLRTSRGVSPEFEEPESYTPAGKENADPTFTPAVFASSHAH